MNTHIAPKFSRIDFPGWIQAEQKKVALLIKKHGRYWTRNAFKAFKEKIKAYLRDQQHNHCCYCMRPLRFDKGTVQLDHILDKGSYPQFTFEIVNLVLSCTDCNNGKGKASVLLTPELDVHAAYPKAEHFLWFHPYYLRYEEHIGIEKGWVYYPVDSSASGAHTISICKLNLLERIERQNAMSFLMGSESLDAAVAKLVVLAETMDVAALGIDFKGPLLNLFNRPRDLTAHKEVEALLAQMFEV